MAVEYSMSVSDFTNSLVHQLRSLEAVFLQAERLGAWLDTKTDQEVADYFGNTGAMTATDANHVKSIVGVLLAAKTEYEAHLNLPLVKAAIGPSVIQ